MATDLKASIHRFRLRQPQPHTDDYTGRVSPASPRRRRSASPKQISPVSTSTSTSTPTLRAAPSYPPPPVTRPAPPDSTAAAPNSRRGQSNRGGSKGTGGGRHTIPACDRCRSFKKKCSRTLPVCKLCSNAGQQCSYSNPTSTAEGQVLQLGARVQWLSQYINDNLMGSNGGGDEVEGNDRIESIETGSDLRSLLGDVLSRPESSPSVSTAQDGGVGGRQDGDSRKRHRLGGETSTFRSHSEMMAGIGLGELRQTPQGGYTQDSLTGRRPTDPRMDGKSPIDDPGGAGTASHVSPHGPMPNGDSTGFGNCRPRTLPLDAAARRFVDAYFRNVNRAYPFVDQSQMLAELNTPGEFVKRRRDARFTLLYLVMAIGCTTLERAGQVPRDTSRRFDVFYPDIIQECLSRNTIESIQILVLLALYSLFDPAGTSSYSIVGIAARQAILLGLCSRAAPEDQDLSPAQAELRHRLYWSILVLDRMMAVSHGLPTALTDENADVPLPGLTVDEFASPERAIYARNLQTSRHVIQLRQLEDRILRSVHFVRRSRVSDYPSPANQRSALAAIRADVEDWYSNGCLMSPMEADNVPIHSSVTWLSARYYHLLLLLYYPNHFNASAAAVSRGELLQFARKQLQSTAALFQQRQLPLNRVTLCRLFPVTLVLMYDYAASCSGAVAADKDRRTSSGGAATGTSYAELYAARDEVAVLISMLEAFPEAWTLAHQAAQVVRQFAGVISAGTSGNTSFFGSSGGGGVGVDGSPAGLYSLSSSSPEDHQVGAQGRGCGPTEMMKPCISDLTKLMQQMLGRTTCFQYIEYPTNENLNNNRGTTGGDYVGQESSTTASATLQSGGHDRDGMMDVPQMVSLSEDAVLDYGWGLDLDFL